MIAWFSILMRASTTSHFNLALSCQDISTVKGEISIADGVASDSKMPLFFFESISSCGEILVQGQHGDSFEKLLTFDLAL